MSKRSRFALLLALALFAHIASAQSIREQQGGIRFDIRDVVAAGKKLGIDVPDLSKDEEGYFVIFCAHANNIDILFLSGPTIEQAVLKKTVASLAKEMGWPKADYLWRERPTTRFVDLELNDYLKKEGNWWKERQEFEFPVGKFCAALSKSALGSKPWIVSLRSSGPDQVRTTGQELTLDPTHGTLIRLKDVTHTLGLKVNTTIYGYHRLVGFSCPFIFLLVLASPSVMGRRSIRRRLEAAQAAELVQGDPTTRQEDYNKQSKRQVWQYLPIAVPIGAVAFFTLGRATLESFMDKAFSSSPLLVQLMSLPQHITIATILGGGMIIVGAQFFIEWRILKRDPDLKGASNTASRFNEVVLWFVPLAVAYIAVLILLPAVRALPFGARTTLLLLPCIGMLVAMPFLLFREIVGGRTRLGPGDKWYDEVSRIADKAGVKLRAVFMSNLDSANAFATAAQSVVLSKGLFDHLTDDEVRAIAAHEVAHLRYRHPLRALIYSLLLILLIIAMTFIIRGYVPREAPLGPLIHSPFLICLASPLISVFWTNPRSRKHEFEADQFAAELVGDADVVIRALLKIAEFSHSVHELNMFDQTAATHPSFRRRVKALQAKYPGCGAFLIEHPSGALLQAPERTPNDV